jgi:hypothetical protein
MIGVISPSSPSDVMPGHHVANQPLQYASANFQHNLLFGPVSPQFQLALLPQPGSIEGRRDRILCDLLEPFLPSVFSGRRSNRSIFARIESHECAVCPGSARARLKQCSRDPLKILIVVFRVISIHAVPMDGEIDDARSMRIENTKRMDSATDRGPDMNGFGISLGFMGLHSSLEFGIL